MEFTTTFRTDFNIANHFGVSAIKDTYKRAKKEWKKDIRYMTDLSLTLNAYCWYFYEKGNKELSELYSDLYYDCDDYCLSNFNEEDRHYYFEMTD